MTHRRELSAELRSDGPSLPRVRRAFGRRAFGSRAFGIIPAAFLAVFFVYPVLAIFWRGLGTNPQGFVGAVTNEFFLRIAWFTLWQAAASTALTLICAAPLTWAMARFDFPGRRLAGALVTIPFVLPTVVVAGAFVAAMNRLNLTAARHTVGIVLAAHVFFNIAVVVRTVGGYWARLDRRPEMAAQVLGANPRQVFWEVTLPRLRPAILSAVSIVFLFTFTSFGIILLLGGPRMETIETEIARFALNVRNFETAAAIGIVQLVAVIAMVAWNTRASRQAHEDGQGFAEAFAGHLRSPVGRERWAVAAASLATIAVLLVPIVALVEQSFHRNGEWSFANYAALRDRPLQLPVSPLTALFNSLQFALAATGIAVLVGGLAALAIVHGSGGLGRILDLGMLLPLGTSAVTVGLGMLIALDEGPLNLRQSWWIIPIAQALLGIPFVIRAVVPVLRSIDDRQREAARTLGATAQQVRREIDIPVAAPSVAIGAGFAFAISLGEFGATLLLGRQANRVTLPLAIERMLSQPGDLLRSQAMAMAVILMVLTTVTMMIADRRGRGAVL